MISICYKQEKNKVQIYGYSLLDPENIFRDTYEFNSEVEASGYCILINAIDAAVRESYPHHFAVFIEKGMIKVVTKAPIPRKAKNDIKKRFQMLIDLCNPTVRDYRFESFD